ncbi:Mg(2+) transport ATPase, P-type [Spiroplasma clarkii]|uniref:Magnesium-transporting ATPase, P-type 1 n=1 Tax=Spiroplasma clarkii TaxID=2139 RepID=A0A1Y0L3E0_9MOLU|nr:magnesium-translocating P-type ATPase [Spiroplasma clarkii]ARU92199.1 Mg(2+) transport ATPase, P-type [Spiroplasma clarkii]ATX71525.1 Mg(2+) transport ATPase, P-type [Spiroplasma clarkii]
MNKLENKIDDNNNKTNKVRTLKTPKKNSVRDNLKNFTNASQEQVLEKFNIKNFGLNEETVEIQREKYGDNTLAQKKFNYFLVFLKSLFTPFNLILMVIVAFNFYQWSTEVASSTPKEWIPTLVGCIIILTMIVISTTIMFVQEVRSHFVMKRISFDNKKTSKVIRDVDFKVDDIDNANSIKLIKHAESIDSDELVPGDLIYLSNGDLVPADLKIVWSNNLYINQTSLTGESFPVQKGDTNEHTDYLEYQDICYMGTNVISGSALAVIVATGSRTYLSSINERVTQKRPKSSFEKGVKKITLLLISFMLAVTPIVLLIFVGRTGAWNNNEEWINALMFTASIAVGLTPEMLPIIITSNLSKGYAKIKKENVIVKNLNAVQNMGAIDILCTDKTGTITSGEIRLDKVLDFTNSKNPLVEKFLYLNSYYQSGFHNPIDSAVMLSTKISEPADIDDYEKEWEVPFDFERKILSVILSKNEQKEIFTKGAVEEVLEICNRISINGNIEPITDKHKEKIIQKVKELNIDGYRVVGIAHNELEHEDIEEDLIFYGYGAFFDEPKSTSKEIIKNLKAKGIETKVLTGDSEVITRAICKKVDFTISGLYTGKDIDEMSEEQLAKVVRKANVFVKLSPIHKSMIIKSLKEQGHVVGFMGDGINDAPVLRESDVAISFAEASSIAQDAADIILVDDSLLPVETAVHEGRHCLANILKYIKVTIVSNFGNVISVIVALFITMVEPMKPLHLLLQNLLYDIVMFAFIFDKVDKKFTDSPRPLRTKNIIWFTVINGPVSSIFDISTFLVLVYGFKIAEPVFNAAGYQKATNQPMFNASWFCVGLATQTAVMQMYRTEKIPFIQSNGSWQVIASTIMICLFAILIPFTPISEFVGMETPPYVFIPIAVGFVLCYMVLAQTVKMGYIKKFKEWL